MLWIARFYKHGDLTGESHEMVGVGRENGYPNLSQVPNYGWLNNSFSSALVMPGFRVRLFLDLNFTGSELRLDKDPQPGRADYIPGADGIMQFTYFPSEFNDKISSVYCEPYPAENLVTDSSKEKLALFGAQVTNRYSSAVKCWTGEPKPSTGNESFFNVAPNSSSPNDVDVDHVQAPGGQWWKCGEDLLPPRRIVTVETNGNVTGAKCATPGPNLPCPG